MSKNHIHIAAIIATHNRPKFLAERSLLSIKNQKRYPDYLIIVDDSDDGIKPKNKKILSKLKIKNMEKFYLHNKFNKGASGAWNTGLYELNKINSDAFVAILDDDDEWHPDYLLKCEKEVIKKKLDMCVAGLIRFDDEHPEGVKLPIPHKFKSDLFLVGNPNIQGSNLFIRLKALLDAGCFDENLISTTDRDLCIRLADLGYLSVNFLKDHLVNHYAFSGYSRLSTKGSQEKILGLTLFFKKYKERMTLEQRIVFLTRAKEFFGLNFIENCNVDDIINNLKFSLKLKIDR